MILRYALVLLLALQLYAEQTFETFVDKQLEVEQQLNTPHLSDANRTTLTNDQNIAYKDFLLDHSNSNQKLSDSNAYMLDVSKLNITINSNTEAGNTNAVLRDKLTLENMKIRQDLSTLFSDVLEKIQDVPLRKIDDIINNEVVDYLSTYTSINTARYNRLSSDDEQSSIQAQLQDALDERKNLDYMSMTFCTEVIKNGHNIYNVMHYSKYGFLQLVKLVENSAFGIKLNTYLVSYNLSISLIFFIAFLFAIILLILFLLRIGGHLFLTYYLPDPDDRTFIEEQVHRPIDFIAILMGLQFILFVTLGIGGIPIWLSQTFTLTYVFLVALILYRLNRSITFVRFSDTLQKKLVRKEVLNLLVSLNKVVIVIMAIMVALKLLGANLTTLLSGLGLGGFALAFAAKDSISNIFGSIAILAGNVFDQGDWIQVGDIEGTVVQIGLRATTVRTFDNALISVPNSTLSNEGIKNWDRRKIGRQIKMYVAVPYNSDFDVVENAIKEIKQMLLTHPDITGEHTEFVDKKRHGLVSKDDKYGVKKTLLVYLDSFSDTGMEIMIYCFSRSVVWDEWLGVKEDVLFKVGRILEKNTLEIAYPTTTFHQEDRTESLLPDGRSLTTKEAQAVAPSQSSTT